MASIPTVLQFINLADTSESAARRRRYLVRSHTSRTNRRKGRAQAEERNAETLRPRQFRALGARFCDNAPVQGNGSIEQLTDPLVETQVGASHEVHYAEVVLEHKSPVRFDVTPSASSCGALAIVSCCEGPGERL